MKIDIKNLPNDPKLLKKILLEQLSIIQQNHSIIQQKDATIFQKDATIFQKDATIFQKDAIIVQKEQKIMLLEERLRLEFIKRFGRKSELNPGQGELFNEAELVLDSITKPLELEEVTQSLDDTNLAPNSVSKRQPKRAPLPDYLPREEIRLDLAESEKVCDCCGNYMHNMGESCSEKLVFVPAQVKVVVYKRQKYACKHCENHNIATPIKQAPMVSSPIPKSFATSSLLAQIIMAKYQHSLPLYRQEVIFKQFNIDLNRQTMSDWMIKSAHLFKPLYARLKQILLQQPVIQADETTLTVVNNDKIKSYIWVYCSGTDSPPKDTFNQLNNIVLYDYQNGSRSGQCTVNFLEGYDQYLLSDGYSAYQQTSANLAGCWAHARRYFVDAINVQKGTSKSKNKPNNHKHNNGASNKINDNKASKGLYFITKLYHIEQQIKELNESDKQQYRIQSSLPILNEFKAWLDETQSTVLPSSLTAKAIEYCLKQWSKLTKYIESGLLPIDNNRAERAVKPFVIGRKNWLFANTNLGAESSAILYSIIETAKANGLNVFDYLQHCLETLAATDNAESLLPWNFSKNNTSTG